MNIEADHDLPEFYDDLDKTCSTNFDVFIKKVTLENLG